MTTPPPCAPCTRVHAIHIGKPQCQGAREAQGHLAQGTPTHTQGQARWARTWLSTQCQTSSLPAKGGARTGSNKHLAGFLQPLPGAAEPPEGADVKNAPCVLLSMSLLAHGLDFYPSVSHVFVLEPPQNTADFLHRAGRTARAGGSGWVVIFVGRGGGHGVGKVRKMHWQIFALKTRR
jgi:ATP-dependent RNA helicase MRH4